MAALADEQLRNFYSADDEEQQSQASSPLRKVAGGVAAGGAVAGGAYGANKLRNAIINKTGVVDDFGNQVARKGMYGDAAKAWGGDALDASKGVARKGLKKVARGAGLASAALNSPSKLNAVIPGLRAGGSSVLQKVSHGLRKVAKTFSVGDVERIVSLAARIEGLTELGQRR